VRATGDSGVVIGTEYEPEKARAARAHFNEAGLKQLHRSARGRSARDASSDRRAGRFHAGRYLDTDVTTGARNCHAASETQSGRDL
jgi:tRNA A58 N-methylase Trm61